MIGGTANAPPSLAALSEARQLLAMLDDPRSLTRQLEKLAAGAARYRDAEANAHRAVAAANEARAESERTLKAINEARTALEKERQALASREQQLKAREDDLKPKWEALCREALALQGRAAEMAASAVAFARDLEN